MKILIVVAMTNNFGEKGFYNSQEIGMAKAFADLGCQVDVCKAIKEGSLVSKETVKENIEVSYVSCKHLGANGLLNTKLFKTDYEAVIQFADTQLSVPSIYKWCCRNDILYIPYIGITHSQSTNKFIRKIIDYLFKRNLKIFKKSNCVVKNSDVLYSLTCLGANNITLAPVGIDIGKLYCKYTDTSIIKLKKLWGYDYKDKIILFIGRLEEDKRPLDLLRIFETVHEKDKDYKLLMVGKGYYEDKVKSFIEKQNLQNSVKYIERLENNRIWELYRICRCFVNLNRTEIFGMVLLEAMYYECTVIAVSAPGPLIMIENGVNGYLVNTDHEVIDAIQRETENSIRLAAHKKVINQFTWKFTAQKFLSIINKY